MSSSENRLQHLRQLVARIEQLPASPETERMLREVRARVVDVETGEKPRAMRPVDHAATLAANVEPPRTVPAPKPATITRPAVPAPERERSHAVAQPSSSAAQDREWLALMARNEVMSLDDSGQLPPAGEARAENDRHPWRRGLRG